MSFQVSSGFRIHSAFQHPLLWLILTPEGVDVVYTPSLQGRGRVLLLVFFFFFLPEVSDIVFSAVLSMVSIEV